MSLVFFLVRTSHNFIISAGVMTNIAKGQTFGTMILSLQLKESQFFISVSQFLSVELQTIIDVDEAGQ